MKITLKVSFKSFSHHVNNLSIEVETTHEVISLVLIQIILAFSGKYGYT
jgi:hypothetical protein